MQLTAILLTVCCLHVAAMGVSQKLTVTVKESPLEQVFEEVTRQTGYVFFFKPADLENLRPVTASVTNYPLKDFLDLVFADQPLKYAVKNKTILVNRVKPAGNLNYGINVSPLLETPPITVRGRIVNENGEPVVASVIVKGTARGTTSNANGDFELNGVDENAELLITSASTEATTIKINSRTTLAISVKSAVSDLDAVIINKGYYSEKKRLSTGSVVKVDAKAVERQPVNNPLQAIQGRMTGVQVTQQSGMPGGEISLQIRGRNSLRSGGNNPLYIVNGVPYPNNTIGENSFTGANQGGNPLSAINISDIESIEVLKDADATAIYGSRGANGVVLITTKGAKAGRTTFGVNLYQGAGKIAKTMKLLNTAQYLEMRNEAFANDGMSPGTIDADYDLLAWDTTRYTDWQDLMVGGTSKVTNLQASLSGGSSTTQFLFSGGYYRETPIFPGNFLYQKGSGHFNLNHSSVDNKFKISLSSSFIHENNFLPTADPVGYSFLPPNAPKIFDENGNFNWENSTWSNPMASLENTDRTITKNLITNIFASYLIAQNLSLKLNAGYNLINRNKNVAEPITYYDPAWGITTGSAKFLDGQLNNWIIEPQAEYKIRIGQGELISMVGTTFQRSLNEYQFFEASNFLNDESLDNISAGKIDKATTNSTNYLYNALFGRINYIYKRKYLLNITARRDGSSRFGPGKQFENFGAASAAWIFSEESFFDNLLPIVSFGKLRVGYGTTGNDQIPDYEYLQTFTYNSGSYQNVRGLIPRRLGNPDFQWEVTKKLEAALELGLLKDRILIAANYYNNRSSNQLVGLPLPGITGFTSIQANLPATVENSGFELEVNTTNIKQSNFTWSSGFNISFPRNKLVAYPNLAGSPYANDFEVGKSLNMKKQFVYTGVDVNTGLYTFDDKDGNGLTWPADLQSGKEVSQRYYGGFQNTLIYKGIQLDVLFQFVKQTNFNFFNAGESYFGSRTNQPVEVLNRWRKPGDETNIQRFSQDLGDSYVAYDNSRLYGSNRISDASYVRLKNISLSYTIPAAWKNKLKLNEMKVYVQGQNLFTITNYFGWDPESGPKSLPPLKMLAAGFQITF